MILQHDYERAAKLFRGSYGADLGTSAGADACGMPADHPNRTYWRTQVEWCVNRDAAPWAYNLVHQRGINAGW